MLDQANEVALPQMQSAIKGFGMLPNKLYRGCGALCALLAENVKLILCPGALKNFLKAKVNHTLDKIIDYDTD